ncbi:hypothetical protein U1Q18_044309 [Sarracenia purpurea var. burkii]
MLSSQCTTLTRMTYGNPSKAREKFCLTFILLWDLTKNGCIADNDYDAPLLVEEVANKNSDTCMQEDAQDSLPTLSNYDRSGIIGVTRPRRVAVLATAVFLSLQPPNGWHLSLVFV